MNKIITKHIPYGNHKITSEDVESVVNLLLNENLTQGTKVPEFEDNNFHNWAWQNYFDLDPIK